MDVSRCADVTLNPTVTQVAMVADAWGDVTWQAELALDILPGSGTSAIAAETVAL